jgi:fructosamine-3-kinase
MATKLTEPWISIAAAISQATHATFTIENRRPISGGSINQCHAVQDGELQYFVKLNHGDRAAMFEAEAQGLRQLAATRTINTPKVICQGKVGAQCFLVMQYFDLGGRQRGGGAWAALGRQLAQMHRLSIGDRGFGWDRDNTIGLTPQANPWTADWATFWVEQRIAPQLKLAGAGRFLRGDRLLAAIPHMLAGYKPQASLVHGDLWSGNAAVDRNGDPVIFDPAVYYGDREVDIAMTELFGEFPDAFYQAYEETWPLDDGYETRRDLYNLYHVLNHFNMFGGNYGDQADRLMAQLLAQGVER